MVCGSVFRLQKLSTIPRDFRRVGVTLPMASFPSAFTLGVGVAAMAAVWATIRTVAVDGSDALSASTHLKALSSEVGRGRFLIFSGTIALHGENDSDAGRA